MNLEKPSIIINKTTLNTYLVLFFVFSFPFIILLNYSLNLQTGILSYSFRGLVLILSLVIIYNALLNNSSFKPIFIFLGVFWVLYLTRLIIDLEFFNICKSNTNQKVYFYFYAVFVNFVPMIAIAFIKPIDFNLLATKLRQLLKIFVLIISVLIILDYFGHHEFLNTGRLWVKRGKFEFLNPVTIGFYSAVLVILIIYKQRRSILDLFYLLICIIIIGLTASRGPVIFLTIIVILITLYKPSLIFKSKFHGLFYSLIFAITVFVVFSFNSNLINRLTSHSDQSNSIRVGILDTAFYQFSKNPITGTHFLVLPNNISHNLFIDILISLGLIGLFLFIPSLKYFIMAIINDRMKTAIFTIALLFFFTTQTTGAIYNYNEFWLLFSIIIANANVKYT